MAVMNEERPGLNETQLPKGKSIFSLQVPGMSTVALNSLQNSRPTTTNTNNIFEQRHYTTASATAEEERRQKLQ